MSHHSRSATRILRLGALLVALLLMTAGCGLFGDDSSGSKKGTSGDPGSSEGSEGAAASGGEITFLTTNFPTLDPHIVTYGMWLDEQGLLEGLVAQNETGTDVVPAASDTWEVSDDQLTYTFHLRDGAKWSNGDPVTAGDFAWTYERLLTPTMSGSGTTLGANSYQIGLGIAGAADFLSGLSTDFGDVGIEAVSDTELKFTLAAPNPGFLMGLTHPSMLPLHHATMESAGKEWEQPANWVGNGPFILTDWQLNASMRLEPNPEYWDSANVFLDAVNVQLVEGDATTAGFRNNEVDIMLLGASDLTEFLNDPELAEQIKVVPSTTVGYLALMHSENEALQDPKVREALSMGLDRETLAKVDPNAHPGPALVPDSVPGYDDSLATTFDPEGAKALLAEAGYPDGKGLPEINILAGADVPLLQAIVDQWGEDLGIKAKADVQEVGAYVEKRSQLHPDDYAGFYIGFFSGQSTLPYFVGTLWGPTYLQEFSLPPDAWKEYQGVQLDEALTPEERTKQLAAIRADAASPETLAFAEQVVTAGETADPAEQTSLFVEAAATRESSHLILPVVWQDSNFAVRSTLEGVNVRPTLDGFYFKGIKVVG